MNNYESADEDERFKFGDVEFVGVGAAYRSKPQKVKTFSIRMQYLTRLAIAPNAFSNWN